MNEQETTTRMEWKRGLDERGSMAMPISEPSFVKIDGRTIAYDEARPARPKGSVLLLHGGLGGNRLDWDQQLDAFGHVFRTLAMDFRDVGASDPASEPYTLADLADDAAAVLSALGVQQAHVVGISLGGAVAMHLALRHPQRIEKLVLVASWVSGSALLSSNPAFWLQVRQLVLDEQVPFEKRRGRIVAMITAPGYLERHPHERDRLVEHARRYPMPKVAADRQALAMTSHDVSGQLERIQAPTLIMQGELDPIVLPETCHYVVRHIKGARLLLYPNIGHLVRDEAPEQFNRDVLAFLQQ